MIREATDLMDNLNKVTREFGMKIYVKKTKVVHISQKGNIKLIFYVDGQQLEQVSQFRYLGRRWILHKVYGIVEFNVPLDTV